MKNKLNLASIAAFVFAFVIVLINTISIMFPSLIISLQDESGLETEPFEPGEMMIPIIITNLASLAFGIFYFKNKLPSKIKNSVNFLLNFEVSRNIAAIVFVGLLFGYIGWSMGDLSIDEELQFGDYNRVKPTVENWPTGDQNTIEKYRSLHVLHVKNFLLKASELLFANMKVVPFLVSISLVILVYVFTIKISQKRFAGLVAMATLMQFPLFRSFDSNATYENSWTLFYLLSLYLVYFKWPLSSISFIASVFSKPLSAVYLPLTLFFTLRAEIPKRTKIYIIASYIGIAVLAGIGLLLTNSDLGGGVTTGRLAFDSHDFWSGFTTFPFHMRFDYFLLIFILPLTVALFLAARRGIAHADSMLVLLGGIIFAMPLLTGITSFNLHPYRWIPLLVFFATSVGILFSKRPIRPA